MEPNKVLFQCSLILEHMKIVHEFPDPSFRVHAGDKLRHALAAALHIVAVAFAWPRQIPPGGMMDPSSGCRFDLSLILRAYLDSDG